MNAKKFLSALAILLVGSQIVAAEGLTTLFETDFESYDVGTTPSEFTIYYNGRGNSYQVVTTDAAHSGSKSLQLWGRPSWSSNVHYYFDLPESGIVGYEVWIKANPKEEGWVQFVNPEGGPWCWGWGGVGFSGNGYIRAPGGFERPHEEDRWYKVEAKIDVETGECWIKLDGELVTDGVTPYEDGVTNPDAYKGIRGIIFGDGSWYENPSTPTYFDDFKLTLGTNQPPDCTDASPSKDIIWPPNHDWVDIEITGVTDPDGDPVNITIDSIYQDEPVDTFGDATFTPDGDGIGTDTARVRAERSGTDNVPGNGRVYHIAFTANDGFGGECNGEVLVNVPHDKNKPTIDDGALYDSTSAEDLSSWDQFNWDQFNWNQMEMMEFGGGTIL